jgi:hypothetical protein
MTEAPAVDYVYAGRKTIPQPGSLTSADDLAHFLERHSIDYILVAPEIEWQLSYSPAYSEGATRLLDATAELVLEDRITLVYSSDQDLILVYKRRE